MLAQEGVDLIVGLDVGARLDFRAAIVVEGLLPEDPRVRRTQWRNFSQSSGWLI